MNPEQMTFFLLDSRLVFLTSITDILRRAVKLYLHFISHKEEHKKAPVEKYASRCHYSLMSCGRIRDEFEPTIMHSKLMPRAVTLSNKNTGE